MVAKAPQLASVACASPFDQSMTNSGAACAEVPPLSAARARMTVNESNRIFCTINSFPGKLGKAARRTASGGAGVQESLLDDCDGL
jgi:hypothetical protein